MFVIKIVAFKSVDVTKIDAIIAPKSFYSYTLGMCKEPDLGSPAGFEETFLSTTKVVLSEGLTQQISKVGATFSFFVLEITS